VTDNSSARIADDILREVADLRQRVDKIYDFLKVVNNHTLNEILLLSRETRITSSQTKSLQSTYHHDLLLLIDRLRSFLPEPELVVDTERPFALDSDDFRHPLGSANDDLRSPEFVRACENHFARKLNYLDIGCSGGGVVFDFILRGHKAVGIDGSDYPLRRQLGEWRILDGHLMTCDITAPFRLRRKDCSATQQFDVISAWEVLEHLAETDIETALANVRQHLADDGLFVGSVATYLHEDPSTGAVYHLTVEGPAWWEERFRKSGLEFTDSHPFDRVTLCRGAGHGPTDLDYFARPDMGFHFVAKRSQA